MTDPVYETSSEGAGTAFIGSGDASSGGPTEPDALSPEERAFFENEGNVDLTEGATEPEQADESAKNEAGEPQEEGDGKSKLVPHGALHAEREKRKQIEAETRELREKLARLEERWTMLSQMQAQKQVPEEQEETPPDPNEDIFAFTQWQAKQLQKLQEKLTAREQQELAYIQQKQQEAEVWGRWETDARRYAQENPDFPNAAKWLSETRDKQLQAFARVDKRFEDPRVRNAQIEEELKQIVMHAASQGASAAEAVYAIAQSYGYTPQSQGQQQQPPVNNELADRLKKIEQAQGASKTIGQAPGTSGGDEITAEALAAMPEEEFSRWVSDPKNARLFEKLMGG